MPGYEPKRCEADDMIFVMRNDEKVSVLIVYNDDIVVICNDEEEIMRLKGYLRKQFEIKYLGVLRYFLVLK